MTGLLLCSKMTGPKRWRRSVWRIRRRREPDSGHIPVKRLSQWVLCVAAFGSPMVCAADPAPGAGKQLPPATAQTVAVTLSGEPAGDLPPAVTNVAAEAPA